MDKRVKISDEEKQRMVDMYLSGMSSVQIGAIVGRSASNVAGYIKRAGIQRRSNKENSRKYTLNHDYFENIDNEQKAYWLGFMYADGYVTKRGQVGISLAMRDMDHLHKFNNCIESTYSIKVYTQTSGYVVGTEYCRLLFQSNKMKDDLEKHGCMEQKTNILKAPNLEKKLAPHFIRGYLDGDGCITRHMNKYGSFDWTVKFVGTESLLEFIKEYIHDNNVATINKYHKRHEYHEVKSLELGGNIQVEKFLDLIYKDATMYLDRKYDKYIEFKNYQNSRA